MIYPVIFRWICGDEVASGYEECWRACMMQGAEDADGYTANDMKKQMEKERTQKSRMWQVSEDDFSSHEDLFFVRNRDEFLRSIDQ